MSNVSAGYKQTEVGVIPEDWEVSNLESITDPKRSISYGIVQTGPNIQNGIRCLRVVDIEDGKINSGDMITTSKTISDSYKRTILKAEDLVMPLRGKVGDIAIVKNDLAGCNLTRGVALIAVRPDWSAHFCRQYISSPSTRNRLEQSMNGSALQEIPIAALRSFKIALPPTKAEQEAIAEALSDTDALIEALEQLITKKTPPQTRYHAEIAHRQKAPAGICTGRGTARRAPTMRQTSPNSRWLGGEDFWRCFQYFRGRRYRPKTDNIISRPNPLLPHLFKCSHGVRTLRLLFLC
jgi:hypothetical protein